MKKIWKIKKFFYGEQKIWAKLNQSKTTTRQPTTSLSINSRQWWGIIIFLPISYLHISYLPIFVPIYIPISVPVQVYRSVTTITEVYAPLPPLFRSVKILVAFLQFFLKFFLGNFFFEIFFCRIPQGYFFPQGFFCGCGYFWESTFFGLSILIEKDSFFLQEWYLVR